MALRESSILKWQQIISDHKSSHLTVAQYCRNRDISPKLFYKWRQLLKRTPSGSAQSSEFLAVEFADNESTFANNPVSSETGIHIRFENTVSLDIDRDFDVAELKKVAKVLLGLSC